MGRTDSSLKGKMIFVVGARRSGTNWLERVVVAHPRVAAVPSETTLLSRGIRPLRERFHHSAVASPGTGYVYMDHDALLDALRDFCDRVFERFLAPTPDAAFLVERTPEHVESLDLVADIYPDASVLHIIRDGRDVTRSLMSADWGPTSIGQAAEEWRSSISSARAAAGRLERYKEIRYEDLLSDPLAGVRDIFAWLGLEVDDRLLENAVAEAMVTFNVDPRAPFVGSGKWRDSFSDDDLREFNRVAGPLLEDLGYEKADTTPDRTNRSESVERRPRRRLLASLARGRAVDDSALPREVRSRMIKAQRSLDRLLTMVAERRFGEVRAALAPSVEVRLVTPSGVWQGRGAEATERLLAELGEQTASGGRQVTGSLHIGVPTASAVMTFELPDGSREARIIFISKPDAQITNVSCYRLTLDAR